MTKKSDARGNWPGTDSRSQIRKRLPPSLKGFLNATGCVAWRALAPPRASRVAQSAGRLQQALIPEATPSGRGKPEPVKMVPGKEDPLLGLLVLGTSRASQQIPHSPCPSRPRKGVGPGTFKQRSKMFGLQTEACGCKQLKHSTHPSAGVGAPHPTLFREVKVGRGGCKQGPHPVSRNR